MVPPNALNTNGGGRRPSPGHDIQSQYWIDVPYITSFFLLFLLKPAAERFLTPVYDVGKVEVVGIALEGVKAVFGQQVAQAI